jgi:hypothetical protein
VLSPIGKIQAASFLLAKHLATCIPLSAHDYKGRGGYLSEQLTMVADKSIGLGFTNGSGSFTAIFANQRIFPAILTRLPLAFHAGMPIYIQCPSLGFQQSS